MEQQPVQRNHADENAASPVCHSCGSTSVEAGYQANLCEACRTRLVRRPIPPGIVAAAVATLIMMLVAFVRFPSALQVAVANERAKRAEIASNFAGAEKQLLIVTRAYPQYTDGLVDLVKDSYANGDYSVTAEALDKLSGRDVDSTAADDVNKIEQDLENKAQQSKRQKP